MYKQFAQAVVTVCMHLMCGAALAAPDAQEILARSDAVRNPERPFSMTVDLAEYRDRVLKGTETLQVYAKPDGRSGQFSNLVRFLEPARDRNKLMLRNGKDVWFYDPSNQATIRISPQQRLLGQASNGDVMSVNLAKDYQAVLDGEEELKNAEGKVRRVYRLVLRAIHTDVAYHNVEYWVDTENMYPVKARFYTESGRLLKTAFYRRFQHVLGRERPTETVIIDGLDSKWVTVMRLSDYSYRDVPDTWLQRDYLSRFRPE